MKGLRISDAETGRVLVPRGQLADGWWSRFRGLMLRAGLEADEGLLIRPSSSIHTMFMRFTIDAVYLDKEGRIVKIATVPPYRASVGGRGAHSVLELPEGAAARLEIEVGQKLLVERT